MIALGEVISWNFYKRRIYFPKKEIDMKKAMIIATLFAILTLGCGSRHLQDTKDLGPADAEIRVLVAGNFSEFRYDVIRQVAGNFPDVFFKTTSFRDARGKTLDNYNAVIVVDQLEAWMIMNRKAKRLLRRAGHEKGVLFITADDKKWEWTDKKTGVESITAASDKANEPKLVGQISEELGKRIR